MTLWGTGAPRREFLHADDLADACLFLMREYGGDEHVNVGTGEDLAIRSLAELVRDVVAPGLAIEWDATKPDGSPRKLLDVSRLHELGWRHKVDVADGIASTYRWFLGELARGAGRSPPRCRRAGIRHDPNLKRLVSICDWLPPDFGAVGTVRRDRSPPARRGGRRGDAGRAVLRGRRDERRKDR